MKAYIDYDGYIHVQAETAAEKYALRWHSKEFENRAEGGGMVFHEGHSMPLPEGKVGSLGGPEIIG